MDLSLRPGHRSQTCLRLADLISRTRTRTIKFLVGEQAELNTELSTDLSLNIVAPEDAAAILREA